MAETINGQPVATQSRHELPVRVIGVGQSTITL
jgi:hypothetical protein